MPRETMAKRVAAKDARPEKFTTALNRQAHMEAVVSTTKPLFCIKARRRCFAANTIIVAIRATVEMLHIMNFVGMARIAALLPNSAELRLSIPGHIKTAKATTVSTKNVDTFLRFISLGWMISHIAIPAATGSANPSCHAPNRTAEISVAALQRVETNCAINVNANAPANM